MVKLKSMLGWLSVITISSTSALQAQTIIPVDNLDSSSQTIEIPVNPAPVNPATDQIPAMCGGDIGARMQGVINRYPSGWGILVQHLETGETIYHYNADRGFIPASNAKILTTAAALQQLPPNTTVSGNKSLTEWVRTTNLNSNNWYANTLLNKIGGPARAKEILSQLGINPNSFNLVDGSGLSRNNRATPRAIVDTLRVMYSSPQRDLFFASLPTAGMTGTLRNRMKQTPVKGIVHAKTGTLRGVRALSGYLERGENSTLVFSIITNHPSSTGTHLVKAIDEMVVNLNTISPCAPVAEIDNFSF
ncbi:MAG: D-alanyl-D-alanine carboxypeptidase [Cyanobacterium sp. T60_A2020_053]|nr:D-alanyl-D-alanine carboxypeptidase [Cyanobacterium sp. T60_A2020_053]